MCERLLLAFMWVAAVVRVLVPCSISCSTYKYIFLKTKSHLASTLMNALGYCCLMAISLEKITEHLFP